MKRCQKCGYENVETMSFCLECGTPLSGAPMVFNLQDSDKARNQSASE